ncbi:E3 ubiquitin-protein ligase [Forsythia ovata]|uniref:E3 ubiquitin-protein ligase n=1 Tax=Forsythia ovata TaxID=205694 RepID=A0ABD1QB74_9LAMI
MNMPNLESVWMHDPTATTVCPPLNDRNSDDIISRGPSAQGHCHMSSDASQNKKTASSHNQRKDSYGGSDSQNLMQSGLALARKGRVTALVFTLHVTSNELKHN